MNYSIIETVDYTAEYNEDLDGFVLTFEDGKNASTQFDIETNRLHAGFGEKYISRYEQYDDELSEAQSDLVDEFVANFKYEDEEAPINGDEIEEKTKGLEFSHRCGNISLNNYRYDAYFFDENTYKILEYQESARGFPIAGSISSIEISISDYDKLNSDPSNELVRFLAVRSLFD